MEANKNKWIWIILLAVILSAAAIRIRLLPIPLERDEGEYAYAGQLILQGIPPYQLAYNMKLPGIYAAYALIMAVFGQSHQAIHFGLLLTNAATILLVFLLAKRLTSPRAALFAAAAFALLSLTPQVQGFTANAEPFVLLPALAGILLILRVLDSAKQVLLCIASGAFLLGLAFVVKQHGAMFLLFAALLILFHFLQTKPFQSKKTLLTLSIFAAAAILPFALTCLIMWQVGVFDNFRFWTFQYAREYVAMIPAHIGWLTLKIRLAEIVSNSIALWLLAVIGLFTIGFQTHAKKWTIIFFTLFSFLAVSIGLYYRAHYFIFLLPAAALLAGAAFDTCCNRILQFPRLSVLPPILAIAIFALTLFQQFNYYFVDSPHQIVCSVYGTNPFEESLQIADFIQKNSAPADQIAVIGSEPQIYFYSRRRSATGYIYTYALMEEHPFAVQMQREMIQQIEDSKPRFLVFINVSTSWLVRPNSSRLLASWILKYAPADYEIVGAVDILPGDQTKYYWNEQAQNRRFVSSEWVQIFQRKNTRPAASSANPK